MGAPVELKDDQMETDKRSNTKETQELVDNNQLEAELKSLQGLAKQGKLQEAVDALLNIEKQQRLAEDIGGTKLACIAILEVFFNAGDWKQLQEYVVLLSKRRGQLKQAVQSMVRTVMGYLGQAPTQDTKIELIKTLQTLTEGKIYVEIERARLTKQLARMKVAEGNIAEAAEILQEVPVETFGAMAKSEKIAYILEQVKLCLDKKDFIRAQILSKKISIRAFAPQPKQGEETGEIGIEGTAIEPPEDGTPPLEDLKLQYYACMIRYYSHNHDYLEMCRCYRAIYDTPSVQENRSKWQDALEKMCWFVVLAPTDSHQITLLTNTAAEKKLQELRQYKELLQHFETKEIIWWSTIQSQYQAEMSSHAEIFGGKEGKQRQADFKLRVIEHNILVVSRYYQRITMQRLSQILDLTQDEAEKQLSDMVVSKALEAKIDRPAGIVR